MRKTIAAVICTYNGQEYIAEQLNSIINQSCSIDLILVVDDNSHDKTISIINDILGKYDGQSKIIQKKKNKGLKDSIELAVNTVDTDWILFADQDDVWCFNKVERFTSEMSEHGDNVNLIFSDAMVTDASLKDIGNLWKSTQFFKEEIPLVNDLEKSILFRRNVVTGATMAIKTEFAKSCLPITDIPYILHDYWFALNSLLTQSIRTIDEPLIKYRQHTNNTVGVRSDKIYAKVYRTIKKINATFSDIEDTKQLIQDLLERRNYTSLSKPSLIKWWQFEEIRRDAFYSNTNKIMKIKKIMNANYAQYGRNKYHIMQDIFKIVFG